MTAGITVGVVGAGQMGAGIAQAAALAGMRTVLFDADPDGLARGVARIGAGLDRLAGKGRLGTEEVRATLDRLVPAAGLRDLGPCDLVVEAVPERLELKVAVLADVADVVGDACVLATNTSSLSVTEIAAATPGPGRVVGLHFFNPVHAMRLAEVVAGADSDARALDLARTVAEAMGKTVVDAADVAGFLVNRVNRPFFLEAMRIVEDGVATVEQVDRVVRAAAGFRMGPFELMDLIGIDTNHAIAESFLARSFGEPRFRPSPLAAQRIAAGHLGRKSGRGWYAYEDGHAPARDPERGADGDGEGRLVVVDATDDLLVDLAAALRRVGWTVLPELPADADVFLRISGATPAAGHDVPTALALHDGSLHAKGPTAAGFCLARPVAESRLVEVTSTRVTDPVARERLALVLGSLGLRTEAVGDGPGLVSRRIVAMIVDEAAFVVGSGFATADDVDLGMRLGVNHPLGPFAWSALLGARAVVATLRGLGRELADGRYRVAPLLSRDAALEGLAGPGPARPPS